jgi:hypothetical protein
MTAATLNFIIEQGADWEEQLTFLNADGTPLDFTGATAEMHVRRKHDDDATLVELSTGTDTIVLGGTDGTIKLLLPAETTATLTRGGVYDCKIIWADGRISRQFRGTVQLDPAVTRDQTVT